MKHPEAWSHHSDLSWSPDGRQFTKRDNGRPNPTILGPRQRAFHNELRVNRLFVTDPPPVPIPRLLGFDRRARTITYEAIDGGPIGPKFPTELTTADLDGLIGLAERMNSYRPRRRWFRRLSISRRVANHLAAGLIERGDGAVILETAQAERLDWSFSHGDITARNVLRSAAGTLFLIDWEWAGLYPRWHELAFVWFSVIDVPDARAEVMSRVPDPHRRGFLLSALLVQLLHLHLYTGRPELSPMLPKHQVTRDFLLSELRAATPS